MRVSLRAEAQFRHCPINALQVTAIAYAVTAVIVILVMTDDGFESSSLVIAILLAAGAGLAGASFTLLQDVVTKRFIVLGLTGGLLFLGLIVAVLANTQEVSTGVFSYPTFYGQEYLGITGMSILFASAAFALPGVAVYALSTPKEVRQTLGSIFPEPAPQAAPQQWMPPVAPSQAPQQQAPQQQAPPASDGPHGPPA